MARYAGKVVCEPEMADNEVVYEVDVGGECLMAESSGRQAVKDYLFVRKGQNIEIEGNMADSHIEVSSAKIDIADIANT